MSEQARIVTVTLNPAVDTSCSVPQVVAEHKLRVSQPVDEPGGGGLNVSRVIRTLGGNSRAYWGGGGTTGMLLAELLDQAGLDHRQVEVTGKTRRNLAVYEENSGLQYRFTMPGVPLSEEEARSWVQTLLDIDPAPDYLVLSGSLPPGVPKSFYAELARRAGAASRVILDTSGEALREGIAAGVHLVKPNLKELEQIEGRELGTDEEIEAAARKIVRAGGARAVVVSLGGGGAALVTAETAEAVRSPTVPIRSKVGAGDSMVAGMTLALARGGSYREAARFGVAAGAAAVMTPGSRLCTREDTERLYELMGRPGSLSAASSA